MRCPYSWHLFDLIQPRHPVNYITYTYYKVCDSIKNNVYEIAKYTHKYKCFQHLDHRKQCITGGVFGSY